MRLYNKEQSVKRMNELGALRRPFIFVINYLQDASYIEETDEVNGAEIRYDFNGYSNQDTFSAVISRQEKAEVAWRTFPESFDTYRRSFQIVRNHISAGNSFLTNLTCQTPVQTNLTLEDVFLQSKAMYKLWVKNKFTVFSPEIFVRIKEGIIYSYPMKGTIDASLPNAPQLLMDDVKEAAEHATIVDLIRNDLSMIASHVHVSRYRYLDTLQTNQGAILQTSSEIQGVMPGCFYSQLGSLFFCLLPAGSITGAPKIKTMEIIQEAERYDRGFYTGVMGYFDGTNLDSAVMIRFMEQQGEKLFFKSGGGITSQSDVESEYKEMIQKVYVPIY